MKKTFLALTIMSATSLNAAMLQLTTEETDYFKKHGLPIPGIGVTIVEPSRSFAANKALLEQKKDGYRHEFSQAATNLLHIDALLQPEIKRVRSLIRQKQSADISTDAKDVTMAYPFKPVPSHIVKRVIMYAPTGVYAHNGNVEGWVGLTEYFESYFAPCSYEEVNVVLTGSATIMDSDTVTYEVANKTGEYFATGDSTGYLYQIEWIDDQFRRKLRCATKVFDSHMHDNLVELAKVIDAG